ARVRSEASRIAREILGWTEWLWYHYGSSGDAGWSSPVARWAHNPKVAGSNPAPATKFIQTIKRFWRFAEPSPQCLQNFDRSIRRRASESQHRAPPDSGASSV